MKKILLLLACASSSLIAQTIVSTSPQNKKILLEEFTGTGCPNCPGGHTMAANILAANPGNAFVLAHHPIGSSYTTNDPMKHAFPSAFYAMPFISSTTRYMPSAIINRRSWGSDGRISGVNDWTSRSNTIKAESAPVNVGVLAVYNPISKQLTVTAEAYFTSAVSANTTINIMITEDGIIATQSGSSNPSYVHNHVFRDALTAQWGDAITGSTGAATLKTFNYTFDNSSKNYDMTKCKVVAFVRDASNEEVLNANGVPVTISASINQNVGFENSVKIFPNPINQNSVMEIKLPESGNVQYSVINVVGQKIYSENLGALSAGNHSIELGNKFIAAKGVYFINITLNDKSIVKKIILE